MTKRFNTTAHPILSTVIDSIEASLHCSKFRQFTNRIEICISDDVKFKAVENKELAEKGFASCLIKSYEYGSFDVSIIINMRNCNQHHLAEREIAAVVFHELGHILNEPELKHEPTFEFCFIHGIQFDKELLDKVRTNNSIAMEVFADSYANKHGYGKELISTFHKQNENFEQKIEYCSIRIEKIQNEDYCEGKILSVKNTGG